MVRVGVCTRAPTCDTIVPSATKGTKMDEFESIVLDAQDARYAGRGCTATRVGDAVMFAKNGVVWEMIVKVGDAYVTVWAYDDARTEWRTRAWVESEDGSIVMCGSMALEAMAFDRA